MCKKIPEGMRAPVFFAGIAAPTIPAVDGRMTLLQFGFNFDFGGHPHVSEWGADIPDKPTGETKTTVYQISDNVATSRMFSVFSSDLSRFTLTKHQIGEFVASYPELVRRGSPTLFLMRNNGHFFIVKVTREDARVRMRILYFERDLSWLGRAKPWIVIPV